MYKTINSRIKLVRKEFCNGKNKEFAVALGENPNTVNNWIRDGYKVGRGVSSKIADKFNIDINWLLTGEGNMLKGESEAEKLLNELPENVLLFLKLKMANMTEADLKSMNVGDLLFLQMLERIKNLEKNVEKLQNEIEELKKGSL
jgi:transcriptional regulator with XRE-family HTH domain